MTNEIEHTSLMAVSPLDGRYARDTRVLQPYFSEFALLRGRIQVEIEYLLALSHELDIVRPLTAAEDAHLRSLVSNFSAADAAQIKEIEKTTRHDVKSVEYFLRSKLQGSSLEDVVEWLHFGLTSEDVNLIAQASALREACNAVLVPALDGITARLAGLARTHKSLVILGRTHGQAAVPTTLGKEFAVFLTRLKRQRNKLAEHRFETKLAGAVGNFNALVAAYPEIDWIAFSQKFIRYFRLEPNLLATQLIPYDNWVVFFNELRLANTILIDLAQDVWRYISDDYIKSRVVAGEVGSSTMPQKVNPIDFENAEGNLGTANAMLDYYAQKMPISRLQRDLSDSTVRRTFGVALGHSLLAYINMARGLDRLDANEERICADLEHSWVVVAEGAQTILRAAGVRDAYETLKSLTRGRAISQEDYLAWIDPLAVDENVKARLRRLTPSNYIGLAEHLVEYSLNSDL
ncbi:MAG: adenylosuccinate lyase [Chloroflexota bacterium]